MSIKTDAAFHASSSTVLDLYAGFGPVIRRPSTIAKLRQYVKRIAGERRREADVRVVHDTIYQAETAHRYRISQGM